MTSRAWLVTGALTTFLAYLSFSPPLSGVVPPYLYAGSFIRGLVGEGIIKLSWGIVVVLHTAESLYTAILVKRHRTPFGVGVSSPSLHRWPVAHPHRQAMYVLGTLLFGFPSWLELKKNVQAARIDSILKGK